MSQATGQKPDTDDGQTPMQRFESFARKLFAVPKSEIDEQREKEQQERDNGHRAE